MGTPAARWVLLTTVLGSGVVMLDGTVVNVALERIGADLGASFGGLQWTVNAYTLTLASLILLGGSLGDRFGRRRVFVIGVVWFAVASLLCGSAPNLELLVAGRALQGVGGALLTPGQPGADLRVVPRPGPGRGDRRLVGAGRDRWSGRPVRGRLAGRVDLAGGVPDQPAAGRVGGRRRAPARARVP
jgi:MFS family permease